MTSGVDEATEKIRSMQIRGALDIGIAAAETLKNVVDSTDAKNLISELEDAGLKLKSAAISLPNSVDYVIYLANKIRDKEELSEKIQEFIDDLRNSINTIAEIGSNLINDGDVILTHCQSDTVGEILKKAWDDGRKINVICTETRPRNQGYLTAKKLSGHGIPTTLIVDSAAYFIMKEQRVNKVIVGADTIKASGDVINKIGTSQIALCAHSMNIPVIVAAESIKFSPQSIYGKFVKIEERSEDEVADIPGVKIRNPAFDVTPSEHLDMIVTEHGIINPIDARSFIMDKFDWKF